MSVPVDDVGQPVFVDVVDKDRHAGTGQVEARVELPFPFKWLGRSFEPAVGDHEIATAVAVDVAETEAVSTSAHLGNVLVKLAGPLDGGVAHEAVENHVPAGVGNDLDVAVAGGVDLSLDPFELVGFSKLGALAAEEMRVYDARSNGFWPGEGCGFVVLMRHEDAIEQHRRIHTVVQGLYNRPSNLNNVETWANVPLIVNKGSNWYNAIGAPNNSGTKIFSLVGKVNNTGLVEAPMGMTLRQIIFDIGGGIVGGKEFKAVQTGGPSGGCLPADKLDLSVDFDTLWDEGSMMGSGGMIVMDERTCMVDVAKYFLGFLKFESCGKCTTCREGLRRLHELVTDITEGRGTEETIKAIEDLSDTVEAASLCALGTTAMNPVRSTLKLFRDEYVAHIEEKKCPAAVCKELITFTIDAEACTGCLLCKKRCPQDAVIGKKEEPHTIIQEKCIKCGICEDVCKDDAVRVA